MHRIKFSLKIALQAVYARLLRLYPPAFYQDFGVEMTEVFSQVLETGFARGLAPGLLAFTRELWDLPPSLLREYRLWPGKRGTNMAETNPINPTRQTQPAHPGWGEPAATWGEALLAGLPYVLLALFVSLPQLLVSLGWLTQESPLMNILQTGEIFIIIVLVLAIFVLAWRRKWPSWTGTYVFVFLMVLMYFLLILVSALEDKFGHLPDAYDAWQFVIIPLLIGVVLYRVTRADRLKGLLAAFPVIYLLWNMDMELVPDQIEATITLISLAMIAVTAILALRIGEWRTALFLMLFTNFVVGIFFAYAGTYHGGTLPFTAPAASPLEVIKSFIPTYALTVSLWLGPLLARMFREIGLPSGRNGALAYRVTLLGLLLVIAMMISTVFLGTNDSLRLRHPEINTYLGWFLYLGLGLYLVGLVWLFWIASKAGTLPDPLTLVLLSALPLALPFGLALFIIFGSRFPISPLFGIPTLFALPPWLVYGVTVVWVCLTVWLVAREERLPAQPEAVLQPG